MNIIKAREDFHKTKRIYDSALLTFEGTDGWDVYNCSIPFESNGKTYIFGRVEKRGDYANSTAWLFEKVAPDTYRPVTCSNVYPLEDPFVQVINGELILGGTHVRKTKGKIDEYRVYFYRGTSPEWMTMFTCGPSMMKDVRLVELKDGRVGVFSRPSGQAVREKYGTGAVIGFAVIDSIDDLNEDVIAGARVIDGLFDAGEWGGCNQCYLLKDGRIGVVGHRSYSQMDSNGINQLVYTNISFIFDPETHTASDMKFIGDKPSYPATECKKPNLADCVFASGIVKLPDGKCDLYSGLGDVTEGRLTIDFPFGDL